jgi:hypothetical protein
MAKGKALAGNCCGCSSPITRPMRRLGSACNLMLGQGVALRLLEITSRTGTRLGVEIKNSLPGSD